MVKFAGLNDLSDPQPEGASPAVSRAPDVFGTPIRFVLPSGLSRNGPSGLLRHLGVKPGAHPEEELCTLIDQRAEELPLPDGCVVVLVAPVHRVVWSDTLGELSRGACKSTGGTAIACVAEHMAAKGIRRALIITDGWVGTPGGRHLTTLSDARVAVAFLGTNVNADDLEAVSNFTATLPIGA